MNNQFCFVAPMYNASKTLGQMIMTIMSQSYSDWKIILIDDVSTQQELAKEKLILENYRSFFKKNGIDSNKIIVHWNDKNGRGKQWEMSNVLYGISQCNDDDIIVRIDADDYLTDNDALNILNIVYNDTDADAVWTAHRWNILGRNISAAMHENADPYKFPWVSSHMKTFRKKLINGISYENFLNQNGDLIKRTGDQGLYLPILHKTKKRLYIPLCTYHYTIDEQDGAVYHTDDAKFQKSEADFIRSRGYVSSGTPWEEIIK